MAARPKLRRFRQALERIAEREGFEGPTAALDYVISLVEAGTPVARLWVDLQAEAGESCVRGWIYNVMYSLAPDAKARIREARRIGAAALADEALEISDRVASTAAEAASNRLAVDTRKWLAGVMNRDDYGDSPPKVQIGVNVGQMLLDALRVARTIPSAVAQPQLPSGEPDFEVVTSGDNE